MQCFCKIQGSHKDTCGLVNNNRSFASKFKFLVLLAFGITFYIRLMKTINFITVTTLLSEHSLIQLKSGQINAKAVQWQLSCQLAYYSPSYDFYFFIGFPGCFCSMPGSFKALLIAEFFKSFRVGLAKIYRFFISYFSTFFDDLFIKLVICRIGNIFLLNGCIHAYNYPFVIIFWRIIYPNAFLQN